MKEILEAKLEDLEWLSENAGSWEYYLGQYNLCKELLSQCNDIIYSAHQDDYYDGYYDEDWPVDEWSAYNDEQQWYKDQEMEDMFNINNKHTICNESNNYSFIIGKNVMNIDSYWFTQDEIEAFRVIWQRRISHEE